MTRRARLTVAYHGGAFHGFAEADGVRTVMGDLREAIDGRRGMLARVVRGGVIRRGDTITTASP